jgi:hypothetical protein
MEVFAEGQEYFLNSSVLEPDLLRLHEVLPAHELFNVVRHVLNVAGFELIGRNRRHAASTVMNRNDADEVPELLKRGTDWSERTPSPRLFSTRSPRGSDESGLQRRTVSAYVINIVMLLVSSLGVSPQFTRTATVNERKPSDREPRYISTAQPTRQNEPVLLPSPEKWTIRGFVLGCLRRSWEAESSLQSATARSKTRLTKPDWLVAINRELTRGSGKPPVQTRVR